MDILALVAIVWVLLAAHSGRLRINQKRGDK